MTKWVIGVIGGSGLYEIDGLEGTDEVHVETPWGPPSDALIKGHVGDVEFVEPVHDGVFGVRVGEAFQLRQVHELFAHFHFFVQASFFRHVANLSRGFQA